MNSYRKMLAFGAGVGVAITGSDLEVAVARVRPSGANLLGRATIRNFHGRPASEWGAEYGAFLKSLGESRLSATVLAPRADVIVRHLALPGVARKDLPTAVALQLDSLHPYGDDEIAWGWSPLDGGAVLVAIQRRSAVERYVELFAEAGIAVGAVTVSSAAVHAALRLFGAPPAAFLAAWPGAGGAVEIYGESPARPAFSAEFDTPPERALALGMAELRLEPGSQAFALSGILPKPGRKQLDEAGAPAYAAALAGACPWVAPFANVLPAERRVSNSRAMFVPTAALAGVLLVCAVAALGYSSIAGRQYVKKIEAEIARLEPEARKAGALDRNIAGARARTRMLDAFRGRTKADLDALNELTKLLPPPVWANNIELMRDSVIINGEAESAATLLKQLDASPHFQNSEFSVISRTGNNELFRIRTMREERK